MDGKDQTPPAYSDHPSQGHPLPGQPSQGYPPPSQGYPPPQGYGYPAHPQPYMPPVQQQQTNVVVVGGGAPAQTVVVNQPKGVNHCLHCCITIFFPPWIIVWICLTDNFERQTFASAKASRTREITLKPRETKTQPL